ncbi:hypothetical protein [Desulfobacter vibrioformis]|uniref:hypothetical protein n=1 Tax=Desulfobacter vibrioformis TaxID=34031 RepID=UPI00054EFC19|nr:hypothetical protein [Desulfobacter vibrioformis]
MTKKETEKISSTTLGLIVGCFVVILALALGLLYPKFKNIQAVKADWLAKAIRLEDQKQFYSVYAQACRLADTKFDNALPLPQRKAIPRDEVSGLTQVFKQIAEGQRLILSENRMDTESFKTGADLISVNMTYKGEFLHFRPALIELIKLPCFKRLETVEIRTDRNNVRYCSIRFRIAIEHNGFSKN